MLEATHRHRARPVLCGIKKYVKTLLVGTMKDRVSSVSGIVEFSNGSPWRHPVLPRKQWELLQKSPPTLYGSSGSFLEGGAPPNSTKKANNSRDPVSLSALRSPAGFGQVAGRK